MTRHTTLAVAAALTFCIVGHSFGQEKSAGRAVAWNSSASAAALTQRVVFDSWGGFQARASELIRQGVESNPDDLLFAAFHAFMRGSREDMDRLVSRAATGDVANVMMIAAWRERMAGRNASALALSKAVAELYPDDLYAALEIVVNGNVGPANHRKAAAAYRDVAKRFAFAAAYNQAVNRLLAAGDTADAMVAASEYIAAAPNKPHGHVIAGNVAYLKRDFLGARTHYGAALQVDATFAPAHQALATLEQHLGDLAAARSHLEHAKQYAISEGDRLGFMRAQSVSLAEQGKNSEAVAILEKVLAGYKKLNNQQSVALAYRNLGMFAAYATDKTAMKKYFQAAAEANDPPAARLFGEIFAYAEAGMGAEAQQALDAYVKTFPATPTEAQQRMIHGMTGYAALASKRPEEALQHFAQADQGSFVTVYGQLRANKALGKKAEVKRLKEMLLGMPGSTSLVSYPTAVARAQARKM